ncbi:MAG: gliding motility-associated C-terminal domain-containing protein [Winogradskyella sp.]|uniref:gliding motility-associated C-terminal domain-containing protein n=1 Tax=Winogradskyella sp. TaxID=1883156 RepID=UPI000F3D1A86|nr:gliding motility-associated C-terminal domain-containing protein [Winogradskyella sp.]RNC88047.1 MAG: gliding motility-associated C-terminal domain-containing protein [Winogradskyella sp.]
MRLKLLLLVLSYLLFSAGDIVAQTTINVDCDAGTETLNYCYVNNETETFTFTSTSGFPVIIEFINGPIESCCDDITIYDGPDNTGTVLFQGNNSGNLAGIIAESTGDSLFLEIDSDPSISCDDSTTLTPWEIEYRCLTCIPATVEYDIISNCDQGNLFSVEVNITDTGDAASINIDDNIGFPTQTITEAGIYMFGPYGNGTDVVITVSDADDINCTLQSGILNQAFCPQLDCEMINAGSDVSTGCTNTDEVMLSATFATSALTSDTSEYNINPFQCPLEDLSGTPTGLNIDDRWSEAIDLGFNFEFFGQTYSQVVIGANGLVSFDISEAGEFCPWSFEPDELIPTSDLPTNAIHGAYHDIDPSEGGDIEYTTVGEAPNRQFKVSFVHIPHFSCNELLTTQQIILYEATNIIDVVVLEKPTCQSWNDGLAVIGIQNASGTVGYTPPGRNTGNWSVTEQELWRFVPEGDPNYVFEWFDQDGNSLGNDTTIVVDPDQTTTYTATVTYTASDNSTSTLSDDVTVFVLDESPMSGVLQPLVNCANAVGTAVFNLRDQDTSILDGQTGLNISYYETFDDADNAVNEIQNPESYENSSNPQTVYFRLEQDISSACYSVGNFSLVVTDFDTNLIGVEQGCMGNDYAITIMPIDNSFNPQTVTYQWFGPVGADLSNNTSETFVATVDGVYTVEITTDLGCVYSKDVEVSNAMCVFPQGLSPNNDSKNDVFDLSAFNVLEIEIFNRQGRSVYQKSNYTNEWVGQSSSDGELPVGTYFYIARLENDETRDGWIYLQR